ncbi:MAG: threonine aldolase [Actinomycetota bacterium]|nr:threonine aldolase [Actinomycetota bacterium]
MAAAAPVNLYSDTQTMPTPAMRRAIAEAEVGDEQQRADPSVNELCERVADLLGFEAAVFLPTGSMCNEIGVRLHIRPGGDAIFLHDGSHILRYEAGGAAAISGAVTIPLDGARGMYAAETLAAAVLRAGDRHGPRPRLATVEQTTNIAGGCVWPLEQVRAVVDVAKEGGLRTHLDGARLLNASVAAGVKPADWCRGFDTAWIDFTKGLGAPLGAALAGSSELIEEAWRYKHMLGGAMRQAGMMAAGALHALDHHVDRLADDHANAQRLVAGLGAIDGITLASDEFDTNIVIFDVADAPAFVARMAAQGVLLSHFGPTTVRAVTHLDVDAEGIDAAIAAAREVCAGRD